MQSIPGDFEVFKACNFFFTSSSVISISNSSLSKCLSLSTGILDKSSSVKTLEKKAFNSSAFWVSEEVSVPSEHSRSPMLKFVFKFAEY